MNNYQTMSRRLLGQNPQAWRGSQAPYWLNQRPLLDDRWLLRAQRETQLPRAGRRAG